MNTFNNMKIGTKLILSFGLILIFIIAVGGVGLYSAYTLNNDINNVYDGPMAANNDIDKAALSFALTRIAIRSAILYTDPADVDAQIAKTATEDANFKAYVADYEKALLKIKNSSTDPKVLEKLKTDYATYMEGAQAVLNLAREQKDTEAFQELLKIQAPGNNAIASADALADSVEKDTKKIADDTDVLFTTMTYAIIAMVAVAIIIAISLATLLLNSITGPLQRGVYLMQEMSLGHLSNRMNMERKDEIGVLARAMDVFAADLQNTVIGTLRKVADGDLSMDVVKKDERDEISPALIQITTSLRGLVTETSMLTRAGVDGKLSVRGDASKFKGGYHEIVQGINNTLDAVIGPLNVAANYMDKIAGGVVPAPITDTYNGDFNTLKNNLNRMSDRLREMLTSISDAANNLGSATAEILAATTQQASGASEQSAAISQTTTTVEEVKTSTEQAAMRAQDVATASQRTVEVARNGQNSVQATIESMAMIKERVEGISENLLALSDQTQQIGEIISTVNEIASQSNMLALNASVEAARAGEHGKGFAVVATEVRSLAEQSKQATEQIKAILSEIQKATNSTVMATEEGVKGVDRGVQLSTQSRESIEQLAAVINESAQVAAQVVASGQQQQTGIDQISLAMQNINQVTMQSLASTRQTEKSAQSLNDLARKMSEILAQYRF